MSNEISDIQRIISRLENNNFPDFQKNVDKLSPDTKKIILQAFSRIKKYHEKNLSIFPKLTNDATPHFIHVETKKKLTAITKKGQYLYNELTKK